MNRLLPLLIFFLSVSLTQAQGKLKAEYYNGINFENYVGTEEVSKIDFYWDRYAPLKDVHPNYCSVRYTGQINSPRTGNVTFSARVDDGIKVWIDDKLIISNWKLNDVGYANGTIKMEVDKKYNIKIEYFNAMNEAELRLLWQLPPAEDRGWLSKFWEADEKPTIISSEHFSLPLEKKKVILPRA